jgi:2,4-dienoyl-CoA reductase-like NADH-dependent reductase (Old Yellow Enzyme family)
MAFNKKEGHPLRRRDLRISLLFSPGRIGKLTLKNHFVRSATYDGCAGKGGIVSPQQVKLFSDLADGGVGLIITGITYTHTLGQISASQNSLAHDDCIPGFRRLTEEVRKRGAKIAVQVFHAGKERAKFYRNGLSPSLSDEDGKLFGTCRAMNETDIEEVIHSFGDAARRAKEAGFDSIQIHAAHGYLLSQFLSPLTNQRIDEWGGALENRLRLHRGIYQAIRAKVGTEFPVVIKIGVQDGLPDGLRFEEGKEAARLLAKWGYDALEISLGLRGKGYEKSEFKTNVNGIDREAYFRDWCREIKSQTKVPVIMVGGLRSFALMEEAVAKGDSDLVSLSRPLIRQPEIINKWKKDHTYKVKCISCNKCFEALLNREHLHCVQEAEAANSVYQMPAKPTVHGGND